MGEVVQLDAYRERMHEEFKKDSIETIETTVPCGGCGRRMLLAIDVDTDEKLLVCVRCIIAIPMGLTND